MSERLHQPGKEIIGPANGPEAAAGKRERLSPLEKRESQAKQTQAESLARRSVERLARSAKETAPKPRETAAEKSATGSRAHKRQTYRLTMNRIESRLPAPQRLFSRAVNNPAVDTVSNLTGRTVARPSGLIGGGLVAFCGLVLALFFARRVGFELPSSLLPVLVAAGWLAGIAVELLIGLGRRLVRH
jgi:hypothetical protein